MILRSLLALIPPLLIGWTLTVALWPGERGKHWLLKLVLGFGIGLGIDSILYFFWSFIFNPHQTGFLGLELILLLIIVYSLLRPLPDKALTLPRIRLIRPTFSWITWTLLLSFALIACAAVIAFICLTLSNPHGTFDAYAIWNLRARFMYSGGGDWKTAFSPQLNWKAHPDYPLLIPSSIARLWVIIGEESVRAPQIVAGLFIFLLVSLMFSSISANRSPGQAALAGSILAASPWLITIGVNQTADIPTAFFILAACVTWYYALTLDEPRIIILAGLSAGLTTWTKNEGQAFFLAGILALPILWRGLQGRAIKRWLIPYLLGAILPLGTLLFIKIAVSPPGDLFATQTFTHLAEKILTPGRYGVVLRSAWKMLPDFGGWVFPILLILGLFAGINFRKPEDNETSVLKYLSLTLGLTLLGYLVTYVITPHPQAWHLNYSLDRVLFQLFPAFLWLVFNLTQTPENIIQADKA